ncbi:MAG: DNA-3-methyladenine glycosylase 2 family protein [Anaerolineales bacterium]|nr:DNA-3-methyladenine glycosylase 2 family protein [Anaerolineales bacterium]
MKISLPARQPFIFRNAVRSHGWYQMAPFDYNEEAGLLNYVIQLETGKVLEMGVREAPGGVSVETSGKLTRAETSELADKVTWMLGLDMDFSTFYAAVRKEPKLANAEKTARGRVLRSPTFFEDVLKTILTTNTLWAATKRMNLNLINQYGPVLDGTPEKRAFPSPAEIAASSPEVLKEAVRVGYRAPAIHELAVRVASGELDIESFKTSDLPTLELRKELLKIKGVGPYAAANLLLILGRGDFIPVDSWALKLVSHEWYDGEPVTPAQVEERFEKWGEFKGLAYWFWDWKYQG